MHHGFWTKGLARGIDLVRTRKKVRKKKVKKRVRPRVEKRI